MNIESKELSKIQPEELDHYLAGGWFRMQQSIFTTDKIIFNNILYDTIWLRVCLTGFEPDKKCRELIKKNGKFKTEIKMGVITPDHEALFRRYRESISFESSPSLHQLLLGDKSYNVYNTCMINVYNGARLIGTGYFDLGKNSAAGICSIYDPFYKTYSLGKYMIYEKMIFCKKNKLSYFYPGYFVPGYGLFDYKLTIGKPAIEYFNTFKKEWFSTMNFSFADYTDNS